MCYRNRRYACNQKLASIYIAYIEYILSLPLSLSQVESLTEDIKYIEDLLGLPPVWDVQQGVLAAKALVDVVEEEDEDGQQVFKINSQQKPKSYEDCMSSLSKTELDLLYTVYYNDFRVFDYDPCDDLLVEG